MKKIISQFENMPYKQLIDCRVTALSEVLDYYGMELDPYLLFIISGGTAFAFQQHRVKNLMLWIVMGSSNNIEEDIFTNLSIPAEKRRFSCDRAGLQEMMAFIDRGEPITVCFDSNYAHADAMEKQNGKDYLGSVSSAAMVGYDTGEDVIYMNLREDKSKDLFKIKTDAFIKARSSSCIPRSPEGLCFLLGSRESFAKHRGESPEVLLSRGMLHTCRNMLDTPDEEDIFYGISGMRKLAEALEDFGADMRAQQGELDEALLNRIFTLKLDIMRKGMLPGTNTFYRDEFGKGLEKTGKLLKNRKLEGLGGDFIKAGKGWRAFMRLLGTAPYRQKDKLAFIGEVTKDLKKLASTEELLFNKLREQILK